MYYTTNCGKVNTLFRDFGKSPQQKAQKLVVGKGAVGVGRVQKGVHIFCVVLHFLGKKLRPAREVPGKLPD